MSEQIPGRRISRGDQFYLDWMEKRGDSVMLHIECIFKSGSSVVDFELQTRGEPGPNSGDSAITTLVPTYNQGAGGSSTQIRSSAAGIVSAIFQATDEGESGSPAVPNSMQQWVRLRVSSPSATGSAGDYLVMRVHPLNFFDNSKV